MKYIVRGAMNQNDSKLNGKLNLEVGLLFTITSIVGATNNILIPFSNSKAPKYVCYLFYHHHCCQAYLRFIEVADAGIDGERSAERVRRCRHVL